MKTFLLKRKINKSILKLIKITQYEDKYTINIPFKLDNNYNITTILTNNTSYGWIISDEGNTYKYLSKEININLFKKGRYKRIIKSILSTFGLMENNGKLFVIIPIDSNKEPLFNLIGEVLFPFLQGITQIYNIKYFMKNKDNNPKTKGIKQLTH